MQDKAAELLQDMKSQEAYFVEQLAMTRGAIQVLQLLLAESEEETNGPSLQDDDENTVTS